MATGGIYNYHPNIEHPGAFINNQMASQQTPFFFGGSQVPINLDPSVKVPSQNMEGMGFKKTTHNLQRNSRILLPRVFKR